MSDYDLLIVGAGVSGTALLYQAARYTDIRRIAILDKYPEPARVNSQARNNSQTLHCGDIETNYTLEKALKVQRAARMVLNYALRQSDRDTLVFKYPKMVLGVGEAECAQLRARFEVFGPHYPQLELMDKAAIERIEPNVARRGGRRRAEELVALGSTDRYTAVDYGALARSFVRNAQACPGKHIEAHYGAEVQGIRIEDDGRFTVQTGDTRLTTRALVVAAGGHSLKLAHELGYGLHYSCLPVAGSYYFTPQVLNGKVYTVQNDKLPFAAVHGDPDVLVPGKTRFGPTALVLPVLERYNWRTFPDWLRVFRFDADVARTLWDLLRVRDIRNYMAVNFLYEVPVLRKALFLRQVRKIVPDLRFSDLSFARRFGGIRPQLIDKRSHSLLLGEAKLDTGIGAIFNMTPSPGGTACLENAELDLRIVARHLGARIDEEALREELLAQDSAHGREDFTGRFLRGAEGTAESRRPRTVAALRAGSG